jgi:hypothetical protein
MPTAANANCSTKPACVICGHDATRVVLHRDAINGSLWSRRLCDDCQVAGAIVSDKPITY